ncbi:MAG: DUF938 domain-containing protein [Hyphomicrobiales bacterium]
MARFISDYSREPEGSTEDGRFSGPAFERNHRPIFEVLGRVLDGRSGDVLEIGSGPGQHISLFAKWLPDSTFWPSDPMPAHRKSVSAWCAQHRVENVMEPLELDAAAQDWELDEPGRAPGCKFRIILCINVFHIAPWEVACGVLRGAGQYLAEDGALLVYGPFSIDGEHVSESNAKFDISLGSSDPQWGVRDSADVEKEARTHGLVIDEIVKMPSNNFILVIKRG